MHSKPAQRYQKMANSKYHKQIRAKNREFNPVITRRSPNDTPLPSDSQFVPGYHGLNVSDPSEHVVNPFKLSPVTSPVVDSKRSPVGNGKRDSLTPDKILFSTTVNATRSGGFFPAIPGAPLLAPLEDAVGPVVVDQIRYDEGEGAESRIGERQMGDRDESALGTTEETRSCLLPETPISERTIYSEWNTDLNVY
ncbi:uncharacterized protein LOC142344365 [Convolutriloba macropyga]|uniref:uncharacterized protein LOC142344365 n=1 Tax=Convolutriloba macropyga TaxID=536237 RepID=UPI003F525A47